MSPQQENNQVGRDASGDENLDLMVNAQRYLRHVGMLVRKHLPDVGEIAELGSGSGIQTIEVVLPSDRFTCIERSESRRSELSAIGYRTTSDLASFEGRNLSAVFSINCIEHIEDDSEALSQIHRCLKPKGLIIIYVPALPILFSQMDVLVGHYRRYTKRSLQEVLVRAGFEITEIKFVDSIGVIPSLLYRMKSGSSGRTSPSIIKLYDKFIFPVSILIDRFTKHLVGKNLIAVGVAN